MNQRYFYKHYIRPYLTNDRPRNRMLFHNTKDILHRDGDITDWQVQNWVYPNNNFFLAPSERRKTISPTKYYDAILKGKKRRIE